jgi:hypothetical protein
LKYLLILPLLAAAQNIPADKCTISGTVVDAVTGQPLSKTEIEVDGLGSDSVPTPFATSDGKGNFTIVDLPTGQYRLKGHRNGYLETWYGARRAESKGTPVRLEAGQKLDGLEFKLLPFGVIAGTVREQDGEVLARANVYLFRLQFEDGRRRIKEVTELVRTDDLGQYRVPGLMPGRYYVRAQPEQTDALRGENHSAQSDQPLELLLPALYPGVPDPAAARAVEVAPGARVIGIDITLPRSTTQRVTGHVAIGAGASLRKVVLTYASEPGGGAGFEFEAKHSPNGDFVFPAVPPGSYLISAIAQPPAKPTTDATEMFFYQPSYAVHAPLQVGSTPLDNVQIALSPGTQVDGHVTVEGEKDTKLGSWADIRFDNGLEDPTRALIHGDLRFSTVLGPGHYTIDWPSHTSYVLHEIQLEDKNIADEGLTISGGGRVQLEIVAGKDGAELEGAVTRKDGQPVPGAIVVLVPEPGLRVHPSLFRQSESDQSGRFQFKTVPPGTYFLFAWDDVEPGIWWDPEFLKNYEARGERVTLKPGAHESAGVRLIAVEQQ